LFCLVFVSLSVAADWSNWRGPSWNGNTTGELPTRWSETEGVLWKTPLSPWGCNTPIVIGDSIFLTTQIDDDRLVLIRLNKADGKIVWDKEIAVGKKTPRHQEGQEVRGWQKFHEHHNLASPSVVADSEIIIASFGTGDLFAFDWKGNLLWQKNTQAEFGDFVIWWGYANTPLLYENLIIVPVIHDDLRGMAGKEPVDSYLVAYDKNTGEQVWKVLRNMMSNAEYNDAYTSPVLWKHEGRTELLVFGGETLDAYNPKPASGIGG
jgi:outer membrane protein assembly factor BamB